MPVSLCQTCAHDFNPFGLDGSRTQNPGEVGLAIDGNPTTAWQTEQYYNGTLGKPGVGIYLDAQPRRRGQRRGDPDLDARLEGSNLGQQRDSEPEQLPGRPHGWNLVGSAASVRHTQRIHLRVNQPYRYYLVWITSLPPGQNSASVNEVTLYQEK